jgi:hypothetical protein
MKQEQGHVFVCWECCHYVKKVLDEQFRSLTYTFLFSLSEKTKKVRDEAMKDNDAFVLDKGLLGEKQ